MAIEPKMTRLLNLNSSSSLLTERLLLPTDPLVPTPRGAAPQWRPTDVSRPVLLLGLHQSPGSWATGIVDGIEDPLEALPGSCDATRSPCGYIMP